MNPELKSKWLAALRSGEYHQGRYQLEMEQDGKIYNCCLGVLCRIGGSPRSKDFLDDNLYDGQYGSFSPEQCEKYGISSEQAHYLIDMNDEQCADFAKIANYIEQNL